MMPNFDVVCHRVSMKGGLSIFLLGTIRMQHSFHSRVNTNGEKTAETASTG